MQCYLDMDGLLANLFDTVAQRLHRKTYSESSQEDRLVARKLWEDKKSFLERVGGVERLFATLKPYPTNDILIEKVVRHFGGFHICTHPAKIDRDACIKGKLSWIGRHIVPKHGGGFLGVTFPSRKEDYAVGLNGEPNLLIDDFEPYIEAWRERGGVAIRVRADKFANKKDFSQFLDSEFRNLGIGERCFGKLRRGDRAKSRKREGRAGGGKGEVDCL